jgi:hypothetical protein
LKHYSLALVALALVLSSCSRTSVVTTSWKDPESMVKTDQLNKVMVGVISTNEETRRKAEARISRYHKSFRPSFEVLISREILLDTAMSQAILERQGFDGAVIFWLVDKENRTTFKNGEVYPDYYYWDYHAQYWSDSDAPGGYRSDNTYVLETIVYSLERHDLIWTAHTDIKNPHGLEESIDKVLDSIMENMNEDGLFDPPLELSK